MSAGKRNSGPNFPLLLLSVLGRSQAVGGGGSEAATPAATAAAAAAAAEVAEFVRCNAAGLAVTVAPAANGTRTGVAAGDLYVALTREVGLAGVRYLPAVGEATSPTTTRMDFVLLVATPPLSENVFENALRTFSSHKIRWVKKITGITALDSLLLKTLLNL